MNDKDKFRLPSAKTAYGSSFVSIAAYITFRGVISGEAFSIRF